MNKENNRSYVGRSVNIYRRLSQYLSSTYISNNNKKMAICGSILKYGYTNFTFYVLEICKNNISRKDFSERENYWFEKLKPSYNIQDILHPFSGSNHYRFGKNLDLNTKLKISNSLKGRVLSEKEKLNHIIGAKKKTVYCYDFETGKYLMKFDGLRLMGRSLNINYKNLEYKIKKKLPLNIIISGISYNMLLKYEKN